MIRGLALVGAFSLLPVATSSAHDYPTVDRVEFVLQCMRGRQGGEFELRAKCSCALDRLARQFKYHDFVEAQTAANAITIAGERSSALRDNEQVQNLARRYRTAYRKAAESCFLE